jgi:hypothetical protein
MLDAQAPEPLGSLKRHGLCLSVSSPTWATSAVTGHTFFDGWHLVTNCLRANQGKKSHKDVESILIHYFNTYTHITATNRAHRSTTRATTPWCAPHGPRARSMSVRRPLRGSPFALDVVVSPRGRVRLKRTDPQGRRDDVLKGASHTCVCDPDVRPPRSRSLMAIPMSAHGNHARRRRPW